MADLIAPQILRGSLRSKSVNITRPAKGAQNADGATPKRNRSAEESPSTVEIEFGPPNANWLSAVQSFRQAELSPFLYQTVQFGSDPYLSGAIWHKVIEHGAPPTHVRIRVGNSRGVIQSIDIVWSDPEAANPGFATVPSGWTQRANPQLDILFGSPVEPLAWRIFNVAMKIAALAGSRIP